jgi:periplasmic copper chaperone A
MRALLCGLLLLGAGAGWACDGVQVTDGWVREAPPGAHMMAGYARMQNTAAAPRRIERLTSPQFEAAEAHETVTIDGERRMREIDLLLPAGAVLELAPGGRHFMLMGPAAPLRAGDQVELRLDCGAEGETAITLPVRRAL